jgi:hypothetical protein
MEVKWNDVGLLSTSPGQGFAAVAGARTTECSLFFFFCMDLFATFRFISVIMVFMLQFLLPAATGMAGTPLHRTAAYRAVTGASTGQGMGQNRRVQSQRSERTQADHQIKADQHTCSYVTVRGAHTGYFHVPFIGVFSSHCCR